MKIIISLLLLTLTPQVKAVDDDFAYRLVSEKLDEFSKIIHFSSNEDKISGYYQFDLDSLSEDSWQFLCELTCDTRLPISTIKYK